MPSFCLYWVNIRKTFACVYRIPRVPLNMMVELIGQEFQGRAHSGLDDARNIARVLLRILKDGGRVIINEKLATEGQKREDNNLPLFAVSVFANEWKSLQGQLRPFFPQRKPKKI